MRKLFGVILAILLIGVATFGFGTIPVLAADLELTPDTGNSTIIVIGTGFTSFITEERGAIYWDSDLQLVTFPSRIYGRSGGEGQYSYYFEAMITVPADAEPGVHTITAEFDNHDGTGESASAQFTVIEASGPQGLKGDKGDKGDTGSVGPQGSRGATGPSGSRGAAGDQGAPGIQGAQGAPGPKGDIGSQGPMGIQGEQGPAGPVNNTGLVLGVVAVVISLSTLVIIFLGKTKKWIMG
jgi:hypothetical protein